MARVGTLRWASETGGELRFRDRLDLLLGQGIPTWTELKVGDALLRLGFRTPIDLSGVDIIEHVSSQMPMTSIAGAATELCRKISEPWLFAHCQRTFAFSVMLGWELRFDGEVLYLAAMLHDVGLTEAYEYGAYPEFVRDYAGSSASCFAVRGSAVARSLADEYVWRGASDRDALAEAIALHVNVRVKGSQGVEARLVNIASTLDVTGLRSRRLGREAIGTVEDKWPRDESFSDDIWTAWACEAAAHPTSRGRLLNVWGRFRHKIYRTHPSPRGALASPQDIPPTSAAAP